MTPNEVREAILARVANAVHQLKKELKVSHGVDAAVLDEIHVSLNSDIVVVELPTVTPTPSPKGRGGKKSESEELVG